MRPVAVILLVCFLALAGTAGYLYMTANVYITDIDCVAEDAGNQPALFAELKERLQANSFTGIAFDPSGMGEAQDCQFYTYTVRLRNDSFVEARVAEIQVFPAGRDILQMPEEQESSIPARGTGEIQARILTGKDMHNVREMMITYYLWGLPFSMRTTYSK